jgi:CubicO group peptidase (beta-lactamase class C family)
MTPGRAWLVLFALIALGCPKADDTGVDTAETVLDEDWPDLPEVDEAAAAAMEQGSMPGLAVAIVAGGRVAWAGGYGLADIEAARAVTPDTPFMLASVSKTVTAVAVMQAVEDGLVDLDTDINELLAFEVDNTRVEGETIHPRHLGTHTSGIADNWHHLSNLVVEGDSAISLADFLEGYLVEGHTWYSGANYSAAMPGDSYDYSNVGASLFGFLVEVASGTPFDDHCDAHIFDVLGMEHTGWHLADLDPETLAVPYEMQGGEAVAVAHYGYPDYPDGQLRASVADLARFVAAISAGGALGEDRILSEALTAEMLSQQPYGGSGQGIIWYRTTMAGRTVWAHNGGDTGVATEIGFDPESGVGVLVLANTDWSTRVSAAFEDVQATLFEAGEGL